MVHQTKQFWEANYQQNIARMIGICYRYTHNQQIAEDLAHDAFLLAIDKSASFENKGHFDAWLRRIVINVVLQYLRDQKKHRNHEKRIAYHLKLAEIHEEKQDSEDLGFTRPELLEAIRQLPEHHRLVFNLYVLDRFTHAQIAAALGISEGTSKSHLARARKRIKEILYHQFKTQKKTKFAFFLFVLPLKFGKIDHFFTQKLKDFGLEAQKFFSTDGVELREAATAPTKSLTFGKAVYVKTGVAVIGLSIGSVFVDLPTNAPEMYYFSINKDDLKEDSNTKKSLFLSHTATFLENDIIVGKNNQPLKEMNSLKTFGTLLMLSSTLALDTPSLLKNIELLPVSKKQQLEEQAPPDFTTPMENGSPITNNKAEPLYGTLSAWSITYTSVLNKSDPFTTLLLKGNPVMLDLNTQKFNKNGTFCFLDHVDYISVNGVAMKLKETVKLKNKKYNLTELDEKQSTQKYGERVKKAIEITLAE